MEKVYAQLCNPALPPKLGGCGVSADQGGKTIGSLISGLVGAIFIFAFILTFVYLLMGGIQWITSGGDKTAMEGARNKITHAIIGLIIVGAGFAIFSLIAGFFGLTLPNLKLPTVTGQ